MDKVRLDILLVRRGLFPGREAAKEAIVGGHILVEGKIVRKASRPVEEAADLVFTGETHPFVSRGGLKLQKALSVFSGLCVEGDTVLDIGASTGGSTDCLLQHGAAKVYAIDVGSDQLSPLLREDPRVVSMEGINARSLSPEIIGEAADGAVMDVSFISIEKIIPALCPLVRSGGYLVALIKPQFEAGRSHVGKKGVVKNPEVHKLVISRIIHFIQFETCFSVRALDVSPIRGPEGNIEFLLYARKDELPLKTDSFVGRIDDLVNKAQCERDV